MVLDEQAVVLQLQGLQVRRALHMPGTDDECAHMRWHLALPNQLGFDLLLNSASASEAWQRKGRHEPRVQSQPPYSAHCRAAVLPTTRAREST